MAHGDHLNRAKKASPLMANQLSRFYYCCLNVRREKIIYLRYNSEESLSTNWSFHKRKEKRRNSENNIFVSSKL